MSRVENKERTVSAFEHENSLMHYGMVNKRSMIMLISVCVTFVLAGILSLLTSVAGLPEVSEE